MRRSFLSRVILHILKPQSKREYDMIIRAMEKSKAEEKKRNGGDVTVYCFKNSDQGRLH